MVPYTFQVLAKISQNLNECSLAPARKISAIARMLAFKLASIARNFVNPSLCAL